MTHQESVFDFIPANSVGGGAVGFEGPEKRLEVNFAENDILSHKPYGLRIITKDQWQEVLNFAKCTIISHSKNDYFDSFVLSESSLFVFPLKIMIKTCGTTTLLNIIPKLMEIAVESNLKIESVMFSRKNFVFPQEQIAPHKSWKAEVEYLDQFFDGTAYVMGPITQHHWYLYLADYTEEQSFASSIVGSLSAAEAPLSPTWRPSLSSQCTLEMMMHCLDRTAAQQFYRKEDMNDADKFPGVAEIIPGSVTDEFNFTPCGYSMNGLNKETYYTIHVTPEAHCSYASFETNVSVDSHKETITKVLDIFKPGKVTLAFYCERACSPLSPINSFDYSVPGYVLKHKTLSELEGNRDVIMCNYECADAAGAPKRTKRPPTYPAFTSPVTMNNDYLLVYTY